MKKLTILLTLLLTTSFSTLAYSNLDFTLSDFCYRQPGVQDRGGVYYFPNEEVGITDTSICVYKDAYGQYASKGKLKDGKKDGKWTYWYENGQLFEKSNYQNGKCISRYCQEEKKELTELIANLIPNKTLPKDIFDEELKVSYINRIASNVKSNWRYQGAEDNWSCRVYISQSYDGAVESVHTQDCEIDNSRKAKSFRNSIERAVYKSSPLPAAPDDSVFYREVFFVFRVN